QLQPLQRGRADDHGDRAPSVLPGSQDLNQGILRLGADDLGRLPQIEQQAARIAAGKGTADEDLLRCETGARLEVQVWPTPDAAVRDGAVQLDAIVFALCYYRRGHALLTVAR